MLGSTFWLSPGRTRGQPAPPASRSLPSWVVVTVALLLGLLLLYPEPLLRGQIFASADASNADAFGLVGNAALAAGDYPLWNPYLFAGMPTFGSLSYTRFLYPPGVLITFFQDHLGFPPLTWVFVHLLTGGLGMAYLLSRWRLPVFALVLGSLAWLLLPKVTAWVVHGHGSKLGSAMYLPWVVAFTLDVLSGRGRRGVALLGLLLGLQILRGHIQIVYYSLLTVGGLTVANGIVPWVPGAAETVRGSRWRRAALIACAVGLAFLIGAILLVPLQDYAGISIRGADAEGGGLTYGYATSWSLAPGEVATFVLPSAYGFGKATYVGQMPIADYPNYLGLLLLVLAACAWWTGRRGLAIVCGLLFLFAVLIAFGRHAPVLYDLLYRYLPFFNKFRVPSMILILAAFAAVVLASHGVAALGRDEIRASRWFRALPWVLGGVGALLLLLGGTGLAENAFQERLRGLAQASQKAAPPALLQAAWQLHRADLVRIGLILLVAASALLYAGRKVTFARRGLGWVLALLVLVDLISVDGLIIHPERGLMDAARDASGQVRLVRAGRLLRPYRHAREQIGRGPLFGELAVAVGHDRVWPVGRLAMQNDFMAAGIRSLGGYHPAKLADYEHVRKRLYDTKDPAFRLVAWLAGRVIAIDGELSGEHFPRYREHGMDLAPEPLYRGSAFLYENRAALPRARLVSEYVLASDLPRGENLDAFLDGVQAGSIPVAARVVLDREPMPSPQPVSSPTSASGLPPTPQPGSSPPTPPAAASPAAASLPVPEFLQDGLDEVILRTSAEQPAILVLADMMAPGWRVEVDGRPAELLRADFILRAVALPGGEHEVRFSYGDPAVRRGLILTLIGLGCVLVLLCLPNAALGGFRGLGARASRIRPPREGTVVDEGRQDG